MIIVIKVILALFTVLYGILGTNECKPIKGFIAVIFALMLIATEALL